MSASNTATGGVKNLRAMFENKASDLSTSPPSRGRSPNGSVSSSHSRPVSKVRTSFVAVEKPGETGGPPLWGLKKTSDINMDGTNENAIAGNETSELGVILKGSPFESAREPTGRTVTDVKHATNGQKSQESKGVDGASADNSTTDRAATMINKMQKGNAQKPPTTELVTTSTASPIRPPPTRQVHTKPTLSDESKKSPTTTTGHGPLAKPRGGVAKILGVMDSAKKAQESRVAAAENVNKGEESTKSPVTPTGNSPAVRPRGGVAKIQAVMDSAKKAQESRQAFSEAAQATEDSKKTPTTPTGNGPTVRPRGGPAKIQAVMKSANEAKESRLRASETTSKTADSNGNREHVNGSQNDTTPSSQSPKTTRQPSTRPKSPTRPGRLPVAATAGTAASNAKKDGGRDDVKPVERKVLSKGVPRVASTTTASSLAKKTSRTSLNPNEQPRVRTSTTKPTDEGFLARMTRPTASSAQKTHEKIQAVSPPRTRRTSASKQELKQKTTKKNMSHPGKAATEEKENGHVVDNDPHMREAEATEMNGEKSKDENQSSVAPNGQPQLGQVPSSS